MSPPAKPIVQFYQLLQQGRPPQRADRSACGTLPTRAFRYCEAATSASAFGWWVFPPIDVQLLWDGADIFWNHAETEDWLPLLPSAQAPGFTEMFDGCAPPDLQGCAPPFLTSLPEAGTLQIWTGLFARTAADWHLLVRAPANLPTPGGFVLYEGIVETDRWFGPLFTNLRFTRSHTPIRLRADFPLLQLQPVPRHAYADNILGSVARIPDMDKFSDQDWDDYRSSIVVPNQHPDRPFGAYAAASRKGRRGEPACPYHAG
jgi:hypothetical protein